MEYKLEEIENIKPHESVGFSRLHELKRDLLYANVLSKPITVDFETKVILNGHLRYFALLEMGFKRIAVKYVNYFDDSISFSRSSIMQNKTDVIKAALNNNLLDPNSTLHYFEGESLSYTEPVINISLQKLKNRVLMVGVFDLFHLGHMKILKRAKSVTQYNNFLIVGVQDNVKLLKGVQTIYSLHDRMAIVNSIRYVDEVVAYEVVVCLAEMTCFDVLVLGEDQNHDKFQQVISYCKINNKEVIVLNRTKNISTTEIKKEIALQ